MGAFSIWLASTSHTLQISLRKLHLQPLFQEQSQPSTWLTQSLWFVSQKTLYSLLAFAQAFQPKSQDKWFFRPCWILIRIVLLNLDGELMCRPSTSILRKAWSWWLTHPDYVIKLPTHLFTTVPIPSNLRSLKTPIFQEF